MELEKLAHFESELTFLVKWSPGQEQDLVKIKSAHDLEKF